MSNDLTFNEFQIKAAAGPGKKNCEETTQRPLHRDSKTAHRQDRQSAKRIIAAYLEGEED